MIDLLQPTTREREREAQIAPAPPSPGRPARPRGPPAAFTSAPSVPGLTDLFTSQFLPRRCGVGGDCKSVTDKFVCTGARTVQGGFEFSVLRCPRIIQGKLAW